MTKEIKISYIKDDTGKDEWWCNWFKCPNCKKDDIMCEFNFCPKCGVKLKWIDTDEQD